MAAGLGKLDDYKGFGGPKRFPKKDVLTVLLNHSDCDGEIEWQHCQKLANRLEELLGKMKDAYDLQKTRQFIEGLRNAHKREESVGFH